MLAEAGHEAVSITVNGDHHQLLVDPQRSLMSVLRDDLDLTGAKAACDGGECGSCTVLLGGRGVMSCLLPVSRVGKKEIVTIEGLAAAYPQQCSSVGGVPLHALQRAFAESGATQCGFCIPGMIMEAQALLNSKPEPSPEDVISRLSRNLCRCTGYTKIIDAVMQAAGAVHSGNASQFAPLPKTDLRVGGRLPKFDGFLHVVGASKYSADLKKEGMLYAKVLRSPHHHAEILSIDTSEAASFPGVEAVVTAADIPGRTALMNCRPQVHLLSTDRVRYVGEAVAAVAAVSERVAEEAIKRIKVEYAILEPVLDSVEAMKDGATQLHPPHPNWMKTKNVRKGEPELAFAEADVVIEGEYKTATREHAPMEPEACLAYLEDDGTWVFHSPHHHPFAGRMWLAEMLRVPVERIRILCSAMGGNFGHRGEFVHTGIAALLVLKTGKPVKIVYTREESLLSSGKAHSYHLKHKLGATKDGRITAFGAELIANGGSWIANPAFDIKGSNLGGYLLGLIPGPYLIPNADATIYEVCTNRPRSGPLRGTEIPDLAFAVESQIDQLAERLGLDRLEVRIMNAFPPNTTTIAGVLLDEAVHARQTMEALRKPYADALERAKSDAPPAPWRRGVGVAAVWQMANSARGDNAGGAWTGMDIGLTKGAVEIDENGRIRVLSGAVEKGQGISIALAQIAAEALDVPMAVMLPTYLGDTNSGYPIATSGQRTTFLVGGAILKASASLRSALVGVAADTFNVPPDDIEFAGGWATVRSSSGISRMSLSELASGLSERGLPLKHVSTYVFEKTETGTGPIYTWVSELVELDVNMETGDVKVDRVTFVVDAGRVINPQILEGQVEGGTVMSLGYALSEKFVPGETRTLKDYGLPTIKDAPRQTTMIALEIPAPGPFGLNGCAESTAGPGMPAIASAIAHAIGHHLHELPARPEVVLAAIHDSRSTAAEA